MAFKVELRHVRLNRGGYDRNGTYWGIGPRLYRYAFLDHFNNLEYSDMVRAHTRKQAKERIRSLWPKRDMRFYN